MWSSMSNSLAPPSRSTSTARITGRMLREPLSNTRHIPLEASRYREIQHTRTLFAPVLEVVRDATRREDKGTLRGVQPLVAHQKAHRALYDVEHVVFRVRVSARSLRMGLEPPFGDGVLAGGFRAVGLEHGSDSAQRVVPSLSWGKSHGCSRIVGSRGIHTVLRL